MNDDAQKDRPPGGGVADHYNTIFKRLVSEPDDLVGLVAYGIYKQAKRDWILRHGEKHGRKPGAEELDAYHDHFSEGDLDRFRTQAEAMMLSFAEVIVEDRRPEIEDAVRNQEFLTTKTEIIQKIKDRTSFWGSVTANMVAWGLSLAVTIAVIAIFNWSLIAGAIGRAFGIN